MIPATPRTLAAEAIGTALLVAAVVGSGIMAQTLTTDTALALLANAIATGAALIVLITVFGPVSGAQFNPAVTLALALRREIAPRAALAFAAAQVAGGIAGTVLAHAMFDQPLLQASDTVRTGGALWLAEGVATLTLLLAIFGARAAGANVPVIVAAQITAAYWFTASTSFANPAVTVARTLTDSFAGIRPGDAPAFIATQIVAAVIAAYVCGWLFAPPRTAGETVRRAPSLR